jgi:hypothetical protein
MMVALVVLRIAVIVFAVEGLLMFALQALAPALDGMSLSTHWRLAAIDAAALVSISSPLIYFWVIRPYVLARSRAEAELRESEHALQARVIDLEDVQCRLEQQVF